MVCLCAPLGPSTNTGVQSLPFQAVKHIITTCDAQPFPDGIAVMITGQLLVRSVSSSFAVADEGTGRGAGASITVHTDIHPHSGRWLLPCVSRRIFSITCLISGSLNDIFRLNYG